MLSEYLQHLQEHDLAIAKAKTKDLPECETPVLMAARWVEQLRCDADTQNLLSSCIVNFDLAVSFAERALREAYPAKRRHFCFRSSMVSLNGIIVFFDIIVFFLLTSFLSCQG